MLPQICTMVSAAFMKNVVSPLKQMVFPPFGFQEVLSPGFREQKRVAEGLGPVEPPPDPQAVRKMNKRR